MSKSMKVLLFAAAAIILVVCTALFVYADSGVVIDTIPVTDLPFPEIGKSPKFTCTFPDLEQKTYRFNKIRWASSKTGDRNGEYTELFEGDTFTYDLWYAVGVKFYPRRGNSFAPANVFIGTINGEEAEVYDRPDDVCIYIIKTFEPIPSPLPFKDVKGYDWSFPYVKKMYDLGIMKGVSEDSFGENVTMTRAMIVQMLYAYENKPDIGNKKSKFGDVDNSSWYSNAIIWAYENGVASGFTDGNFYPNMNVTREQLAMILMKYAIHKGYDASARADLGKFSDRDKVAGWAIEGIKWAVADGLMSGRPSGTGLVIAPQGNATRAEAAVMFGNLLELLD